MTTYERTTTVAADPEAVFAYVSDVSNLPGYMEEMTDATPGEGETIAVTAVVEIPGRGRQTVHSEAWFRVDRQDLRVEWGSKGEHDYHGSLDVSPGPAGETSLSITIHTSSPEPDGVNASLDSALQNVVQAIE